MRKYLFIFFILSIYFFSRSQNLQWAKAIQGPYSDYSRVVTTDKFGNVYHGGYYTGGVVDFDPGPGTYTLPSYSAGYVSKLDAYGNFIWAYQLGVTSGYADVQSIAIDTSGNVYAAGGFAGTLDFNSGPGVNNLTSPFSNYDPFILKLDPNGNFIWVKHFAGGTSHDLIKSIKIDKFNNIYTTGYYRGTVDFDPNGGVYSLAAIGGADIFISKLDVGGNFIWAKRLGGALDEEGNSIFLGDNLDLYVTGYFIGPADFDASPATYSLTPKSTNFTDIFATKYDVSGNFIWAKSFGGKNHDYGTSVAAFKDGNVFVTGYFLSDTADFNPGPSSYNLINLSSSSNGDAFVCKLNSMGNLVWAVSAGGPAHDSGMSIAIDSLSNVYITGAAVGNIDVDPGPSVYNLPNSGSIFTWKLDSLSNFVWAFKFSGPSTNEGSSIWVDKQMNVYLSGHFCCAATPTDFDPSPSSYSVTPIGEDIYVVKLGCAPMPPYSVSGNTLICAGSSQTYSFVSVYGASSYSWALPASWSGGSSTNSISTIAGSLSGLISVVSTNTCGTSAPQTLSVTISPCTTINEGLADDLKVNIFPNPNYGKLIIRVNQFSETSRIEIYNILGELILSHALNSLNTEISTIDVISGIYMVKIIDDSKTISTGKLIKN